MDGTPICQALFEHSLHAVILVDDRGRPIEANPAACQLTGYSRDELRRLTIWDLIARQDRRRARRAWQKRLRGGELCAACVMLQKQGSGVEVELRAIPEVAVGRHLWLAQDITGQRALAAQPALLQRERERVALDLYTAVLGIFERVGVVAEVDPLVRLTPDKRAVPELIAAGKTNREMAAALVVNPHTVKARVTAILRKLGVRRRSEAAALLPRQRWRTSKPSQPS